ncbi:DUF2608 domain-containing protein, partial [Steroidobacter sp.]|uniref:DUF2608 domain-containing protein n=1 Tax=Steroidobacter sp. TaxID=1978227 RepID=UPI001A5C55AF
MHPTADQAPGTANVTAEVTVTRDLIDVLKILGDSHQGSTLLVLDIDDTLLTSRTFFGSDAWYEWQKTLTPQSPGYVPCKFDLIALNYEAGTQMPTQEDAVAAINSIRVDKIILTARSPLTRGGTIRELKEAGYELPAALQPEFAGAIYEYRPDPQAAGTTVSYHDGVLMVAGQNKGKVLLDLLKQLQVTYDRIVLVDDGQANIAAMREAVTAAGIGFRGVHYTRIDKTVDAQREQEGIAGWEAWQRLLS